MTRTGPAPFAGVVVQPDEAPPPAHRNRQLNTALHRIALTQEHGHPEANAMVARRKAAGDGGSKRSEY